MSDNDDEQVRYADFDAIPDVRGKKLNNADNVVTIGVIIGFINAYLISSIQHALYPSSFFIPIFVLIALAQFFLSIFLVYFADVLLRETGIRRTLKKRGLTPGAVARPLIRAVITSTRLHTSGHCPATISIATDRQPLFAAYTGECKVPEWANRAWFRSRFGSDVDDIATDTIITYNGFAVMIDADDLPRKACEILDAGRDKFKHVEWLYECIETPRWQELGRELAMTEPVTRPATFDDSVATGPSAPNAGARRRLRSLMDEVTALADRLRTVLPEQSADRRLLSGNLSGLRRRMAAEIGLLGTADDADATTMERTIKDYESLIREMSASLDVLGDDSTMDTLRGDIDDMNAVATLKSGDRGLARNRSRADTDRYRMSCYHGGHER